MVRIERVLISENVSQDQLETKLENPDFNISSLKKEVATHNFDLSHIDLSGQIHWRHNNWDCLEVIATQNYSEVLRQYHTVSEQQEFLTLAFMDQEMPMNEVVILLQDDLTLRDYIKAVRDFIEEFTVEDRDSSLYDDWVVIDRPHTVESAVRVEDKGMAVRVIRRRDTYVVEQCTLLQDGSISENWGLFGGCPGYGVSHFGSEDEALEFFEDVQNLSEEKVAAIYDCYSA